MKRGKRDAVDTVTIALERQIPELHHPASELARRAVRFASMLEDALVDCLAPWGLTKADYGVLITLRSAEPPYVLRPSELRARLMMTSGGVSGVLNRLDAAGYVERRPHDTDGRSSWVQLTAPGVACADEAARAWTLAQRDALRRVPDELCRQASDAIREVLLALGDAAGAASAV